MGTPHLELHTVIPMEFKRPTSVNAAQNPCSCSYDKAIQKTKHDDLHLFELFVWSKSTKPLGLKPIIVVNLQ